MSALTICIEDLGKQYRIGTKKDPYRTLRDTITDGMLSPFRKAISLWRGQTNGAAGLNESIWALKDISFEVNHGEVVGLIGRNGAGKSTLLKVLSRITEPTTGYAEIHGRVGSLLEVGTGFHPELTGRENIYLNGAILGMRRAEIERKLDEIVAFAEVEKFLDTPVKHFSSGMYLRLAFAVAAHLEPEILLIDEVLAVGDASFQKKCLGKMGDVAKEGRTVLFVSHNMLAVESLCSKAIWLDEGRLSATGQTDQVVASYLQSCSSTSVQAKWDEIEKAPGNDQVRINRVCVRPLEGSASDAITVVKPFVMEFDYWNLEPNARLNLSVFLYNELGIPVFNTGPVNERVWQGRPFPKGLFRSACYVPANLLNDGMYRVRLLVVKDQKYTIYRHEDILVFTVSDSPDTRTSWFGKWVGVVRPALDWTTEYLDAGTNGK